MTKISAKRILSLLLSFVFIFCMSSFPAVAEDSEEDIKKKIEQADAEYKANQDALASLQSQIDSANTSNGYSAEQISALQKQLDIYKNQISDLNSQIQDKNTVINQYQKEIDGLQGEIDEANATIQKQTDTISATYELLKDRLRAAYKSGETSTLEVLLSSEDYESFLTRLELLSKTSQHDSELVAKLQDEITNLNDAKELLAENQQSIKVKQTAVESEKADIVSSRAEVQSLFNTIDSKQGDLEKQVQQRNTHISSLSTSSAEYKAANAQIEKEKDEYDEQLAALASKGSGTLDNSGESSSGSGDNTSGGSSSGDNSTDGGNTSDGGGSSSGGSSTGDGFKVSSKGMICPLQYSNVYISAGWYGYPNHKGIDFCTKGATGNTYGKEIRAAADGKVLSAEYHSSWGNNVFIDHGNGVCTRYAHCSKMLVKKGDTVKQGQVIAIVGNTGNVSPAPTEANPHAGAHLHFEVWINGTRVNPAPYLP